MGGGMGGGDAPEPKVSAVEDAPVEYRRSGEHRGDLWPR